MTQQKWTKAQIPDLRGKTAIVTGANSGLGYEVALGLLEKGAQVIMACRSRVKGEQAASQLRSQAPNTSNTTIEVMELDLADLASVCRFAEAYKAKYPTLDLLCNNAGIMAIPRQTTADGFEMQFGTNHLGHFALTGHLLNLISKTPSARIVNVSSGLHMNGKMPFDDLMGERKYDKWAAYGQSKLANLLFTYELQRRLQTAQLAAISVGCHPGYAATNLQSVGPRQEGSRLMQVVMKIANTLIAQRVEVAALPLLYACTASDVNGGDYIGPTGRGGMKGQPGKVRSSDLSYNEEVAKQLWQRSEQLTGVTGMKG